MKKNKIVDFYLLFFYFLVKMWYNTRHIGGYSMENSEIAEKALLLLDEKHDLYTDFELSYIKNCITHNYFPDLFFDEGIREIFDEIGYLPDDENVYKIFLNYITSLCDVNDKNIIEVGGGVFARLSKRLSLEQKNGKITVYDPRLDPTIESTDRFVCKKEDFTIDHDIGDTDLMIGLMPCQGAEPLLRQALDHDRDFILWLCEGGPHGDCFDYFEDADEWVGSIMYWAGRSLEEKGQKLRVKKMDKLAPYPIITNL